MNYLLDTNVVSEPRKSNPAPMVLANLARLPASRVFISAIVVGELRFGIEQARDHDRRVVAALEVWLRDLVDGLADRILPVTPAVAERWGRLAAALTPTPIGVADALIASTAHVHDCTLLTRNTKHFARTGARLLNPFEEPLQV